MPPIPSVLVRLLRNRAMASGGSVGLWRRLGRPDMAEWAEYLRLHGGFRAFGVANMMNTDNAFTDPYLTSIGNHVWIAGAWISAHDASALMMARAYGLALDSVGPVSIGDDVFIGYGAIVLPNTRIGNRVIVGAGSVVSGALPDNGVYAGTPARRIRSLDDHLELMLERNAGFPWQDMIASRNGHFDEAVEPRLRAARLAHFFGGTTAT